MKYMTTAEIREKFLKYFEDKGCKRFPSSSLIPDDPSLLLTSAGMVQFKAYFLQQKKLPEEYVGTTTVQKCVRTNDIDIIGTTGRHLSFFEMLGNFSFGKYFKKEMCAWALDFSVNVMEMPIEKLYFTVYKDDDETIEIWKNLGIDPSHISKLGEEDNFWRAGPTGPCGPCSELYYDQGEEFGCGGPDCGPGCECDRFLEYWNCVFTQYDGQEDGTLKPLPKKNIDTGMGLERMAAIMQGVQSNYETDILRSLISVGEKLFGVEYGKKAETDLSLRIIADHSRAVTFMIADGILPGNEGREYVLRRLLRRCVMKAYLLGYQGAFLHNYIHEIFNLMGDVYPELEYNKELILRVVQSEEERFGRNLIQGTDQLNSILDNPKRLIEIDGRMCITGENAFMLHDTFGFPVEVTKEIAEEHDFGVDKETFKKCMEEQRERARRANADDADAAWEIEARATYEIIAEHGPTDFVGYSQLETQSKVIAIIKDGEMVDSLKEGQKGSIFVEKTSFYGEMGGQVGDTGVMMGFSDSDISKKTEDSATFSANVENTTLPEPGLHSHDVEVKQGMVSVGDTVALKVDQLRRSRITRNHTATHILHWALREVLGDHVRQAGSFVAPDRLRFDFTHFEGLTADELHKIEALANEKVMRAYNVSAYNTTLEEARKSGVTALFGEKYGEYVRVLEVGDFSSELCGGCHVNNTSEIGLIKITTETSVGANARRLEACTSYDAYDYCNEFIESAMAVSSILKCGVPALPERAENCVKHIKILQKDLKNAYSKTTSDMVSKIVDNSVESPMGFRVATKNLGVMDGEDIKHGWDTARDHMGDNCACVLGGVQKGKAVLLVAGTEKAVESGFNAVDVVRVISKNIQGGGGGKPTMAQAGGKNVDGIDAAIKQARAMFE